MKSVTAAKDEQTVLDVMRTNPTVRGMLVALAEAARSGELAGKSPKALAKTSAALPEPKAASTVSIAEMKQVLRDADCLYDDRKIWKQLGATKVPKIPDAVIKEAYEKGGRVILRCSSISEMRDALRKANQPVPFWGTAAQSDYQESVSKPVWIVVPSHIDGATLGRPKSEVVTSEMPAPTPEDWFSVCAYARLDGGRQPKGSEGLATFTTETGTVVGSNYDWMCVSRYGYYEVHGYGGVGVARFGPPRN